MSAQQVHIIGAGFSGLSLALALQKQGFKVHVYEAKSRTGGMIESQPFHGAIVETAAHSITRTDRLDQLLADIGLKPLLPTPTAKRRYIYRGGKIHQWPLSIFESLKLGFNFLKAFVKRQIRPRANESLRQWGHRVLGEAPTQFLLEPAMQGIYAGDGATLSSSLILSPRKKSRYRGLISFPKGVSEIFSAMEKALVKGDGELHLGKTVALNDLKGPVVIATSLKSAIQLLQPVESTISKTLAPLKMNGLVTVTAHFHRRALHGFGCLVPRGEGARVLGVLVNSCIFDRKWTVASESWIYGGETDPEFVKLSDDEIMKTLKQDRKTVFNLDEKPKAFQITRWPSALPSYDLQLERALAGLAPAIAQFEKSKRIYLHGNYLGGIGLSKILDRGDELIERLMVNEKSRPPSQ